MEKTVVVARVSYETSSASEANEESDSDEG